MLKKTIKYTDFNGVEREEDFFFNLSKAEIMEMQYSAQGGLDTLIAKIIKTEDMPEIIKIFKEIILKSYGEKSDDGKRFIKFDKNGEPLSRAFAETEAFSNLYMELATDSTAASKFVNGIVPSDMEITEEKQKEMADQIFGKKDIKAIANSNEEAEEPVKSIVDNTKE